MKKKLSLAIVITILTITSSAFANHINFNNLSCKSKVGEEPLSVELYTEGVHGQHLSIPSGKIWDVYLNDELACFGFNSSTGSFLTCGSLFGPLKGVEVNFSQKSDNIEATLVDQFGENRTLLCEHF